MLDEVIILFHLSVICEYWTGSSAINPGCLDRVRSRREEGGRAAPQQCERCCWCCGVVVSSLTAAVVRVGAAQQPWPPSSQSSRPSASGADADAHCSHGVEVEAHFEAQK